MADPAIIVPQIDWVATGNAIERRRRQNRLNQRAQRQRRRALEGKPCTTGSARQATDSQQEEALLARLASIHCFHGLNILGPKADSSIALLRLLEVAVQKAYDARSPRTDILLGLTQLNVRRALVVNIEVLGLTASEMHDEALSPFSMSYTYHPRMDDLPASLKPTAIQQSVPHHPWLDLLPDAALRNNLILLDSAGLLDEDQCCIDMCSRTGLIVWRDPWDPTGWEITPAFLERWRLVLTGCWSLLQSTNYWREQRGEKRITREMWAEGDSEAVS